MQRSFTKNICKSCRVPFESYKDRLAKLNLKTLEYRRVVTDLIMTYKIVNGLVHLSFNDFFSFYKSPYNTRRHPLYLEAKLCQMEAPKKTS